MNESRQRQRALRSSRYYRNGYLRSGANMSLLPMVEIANNGPLEAHARVEVRSRDVREKVIPFSCPKSARPDQHGSKFALQLGSRPYALSIFVPHAKCPDSKVICIDTKRQWGDKPESRSAEP